MQRGLNGQGRGCCPRDYRLLTQYMKFMSQTPPPQRSTERSTLGVELCVVDAAVLPLVSEGLAIDAFASSALAGSD